MLETRNNYKECLKTFLEDTKNNKDLITREIQSFKNTKRHSPFKKPDMCELNKVAKLNKDMNSLLSTNSPPLKTKPSPFEHNRKPLKNITNQSPIKVSPSHLQKKSIVFKSPKTLKPNFTSDLAKINSEFNLVKEFLENSPKSMPEYPSLQKKLRILTSKRKSLEFKAKMAKKAESPLSAKPQSSDDFFDFSSPKASIPKSPRSLKARLIANNDSLQEAFEALEEHGSSAKKAPESREFADFAPSAAQRSASLSRLRNTSDWASDEFPWDAQVKASLQIFGLAKFRKNQREIINATLSGKDVFVLMPTGGGKSLCYQLPALIYEGTTVVISPLVSLIQDQVSALSARNVRVASFSSASQVDPEVWGNIRDGTLKLLYITPEKFVSSAAVKETLKKAAHRPRFVIDEAHCVSNWGHDFRPDYLALSLIKALFPGAAVMAMTATATDLVREEIIKNLQLAPDTVRFHQSFNRPNLHFSVEPKGSRPVEQLVKTIAAKHRMHSGIVYCLSRKETETVARGLQDAGINAFYYHAGMDAEERASVQDNWSNDRFLVIVATVAFGMGIDKPDVRFVVHFTLPKSPENYYQEAGRAGRDGEPSDCVVLYSYRDKKRVEFVIRKGDNRQKSSRDIATLYTMVQFCENQSECRRTQLLNYFGERFDSSLCAKTCDNCQSSPTSVEKRDVFPLVAALMDAARFLSSRGVLKSSLLLAVFRGSNSKEVLSLGLQGSRHHGAGKQLSINDSKRLMHLSVQRGILRESAEVNRFGGIQSSLKLGNAFCATKKTPIFMSFKKKTNSPAKPSSKRNRSSQARARRDDPSENLSFQKSHGMTPDLIISLFSELEEARARIQRSTVSSALPKGMNIRAVMPTEALMVFAAELPRSTAQMSRVNLVGASKFKSEFLRVVKEFTARNGISLPPSGVLSRRCSLSLKRFLLPHSSNALKELS